MESVNGSTDQTMNVTTVGPWMLCSQIGPDHGRHMVGPWMLCSRTDWTDWTVDVIVVETWMLGSQNGLKTEKVWKILCQTTSGRASIKTGRKRT